MSQKWNSGRKGKKKKCSRGQDCPYKHEYQHGLEFFHDCDDQDDETACKFVAFSGKGNVASTKSSVIPGTSKASSRPSTRRMKRKHDQKSQPINLSSASSQVSAASTLTRTKHSIQNGTYTKNEPLEDSSDVNKKPKITKTNSVSSSKPRKNQNQNEKLSIVDLVDCESPRVRKSCNNVQVLDIDDTSETFSLRNKVQIIDVDGGVKVEQKVKRNTPQSVVDLCFDASGDDESIIEITEKPKKRQGNTRKSKTKKSDETKSGSSNPLDGIVSQIITSQSNIHDHMQQLENRQLSMAIAESNREIKQDQDSEYYESLRKDQEKEREQKRIEEQQTFLVQQAKTVEQKKRSFEQKTLEENQNKILPEPTNDSALTATIAFRLPRSCDKPRLVRRFTRSSSVNQLFFYLRSCTDLLKIKRWKLFQVVGGEEISCDSGKTLEELGLCPRALIFVKDEDC